MVVLCLWGALQVPQREAEGTSAAEAQLTQQCNAALFSSQFLTWYFLALHLFVWLGFLTVH